MRLKILAKLRRISAGLYASSSVMGFKTARGFKIVMLGRPTDGAPVDMMRQLDTTYPAVSLPASMTWQEG